MTLRKPGFNREFRLGLVVYGGVSLAVYMNGVCREFYNAVRGRGIYKLIKALTDSDIVVDIISGTSAGGVNGVLLSYALTNSNENETFDFKDFADVWRKSGDINELLRQPNTKGDINSLLDGEKYYQGELVSAFQSVLQKRKPAPADDWFSPFDELDLFVTGTDVLGKVSCYFDNTGKLIQANDNHAVFVLKHRLGRKEPFQPSSDTIGALSKLCRITSCFPVAFPVVTVKLKPDENGNYPDKQFDKLLIEWGKLQERRLPEETDTVDGYQLHFVDGGVLDNRPFSYTIREIYYRHFYRPVNRKLFYIDPSPDKFLDSPAFKRMAKPSIWQAAIDSLVGLPRYESIAGDLQEIIDRNEKVRRYKFLRATVERAIEVELHADKDELPQTGAQEKTVQSERQNTQSLHHEEHASTPSEEQIYLRCRLVGLRDRVLPLIIGLNPTSDDANDLKVHDPQKIEAKQKPLKRATELLTSYVSDQGEQEKRERFLHNTGMQIRNLDVDYAIRKHFFILGKIIQLMGENGFVEYHEELEKLAKQLNSHLSLLEVIREAIYRMLTRSKVQEKFVSILNSETAATALGSETAATATTAEIVEARGKLQKEIYGFLLRLHRFLLDKDGTSFEKGKDATIFKNLSNESEAQFDQAQLAVSNVLMELRQRADELDKGDAIEKINEHKYDFNKEAENNDEFYCSILFVIEQASQELIESLESRLSNYQIKDTPRSLKIKFEDFRYIDQRVYPFEYLSDMQTDNSIEIARICPDDADKGFGKGKALEERLAGVQLGAFGGFFKKSWRSNDILWGRLDGLNRLVDCLLTPETVKNFPQVLTRSNINIQDPNDLDTYLSKLLEQVLPNPTFSTGESPEAKKRREDQLEAKRNSLKDDLKKLALGQELKDFSSFLDKLVEVGQLAILQTDLKKVLDDAISEQFKWNQQLIASPSKQKPPQFSAIMGYFDPALTPFATESLVNSSIQDVLRDPGKMEDYFRYKYRVGSEKIKTDIPPIIQEKLLARSGLVVRDILRSEPTGKTLQKSSTFQLVNRLLETFNLWVNAKDPKTSFVPGVLLPLLSWGGLILVVGGIAFLVSQIPSALLVLIITLLILQLIYGFIGRNKLTRGIFKAVSLTLVIAILVLSFVGLSPDGAIQFKNPFNHQNPTTLPR